TDLGNFFPHADHAFGPVHEGVGIALLRSDVYVLETVRAFGDYGNYWLITLRESRLRFTRPLHWRTGAVAFGQIEIVAHSDFVSVAEDRSTREGHHQAVCELKP